MSFLEAPALTLGCIFLTKRGPGCTEGFGSLPEWRAGLMDTGQPSPVGPSQRSAGQGRAGHHTHTHPHPLLRCHQIPSPSYQSAVTSGEEAEGSLTSAQNSKQMK